MHASAHLGAVARIAAARATRLVAVGGAAGDAGCAQGVVAERVLQRLVGGGLLGGFFLGLLFGGSLLGSGLVSGCLLYTSPSPRDS